MTGLLEAVNDAMEADPSICCRKEDITNHAGVTTERMEELGLTKRYLKHLEKQGLAVRAMLEEKSGYKTRWILVI